MAGFTLWTGHPDCFHNQYELHRCCLGLDPICFEEGSGFQYDRCCGYPKAVLYPILRDFNRLQYSLRLEGFLDGEIAWNLCMRIARWPAGKKEGPELALMDLWRIVFAWAMATNRIVHAPSFDVPSCSQEYLTNRYHPGITMDIATKANSVVDKLFHFHAGRRATPKFFEGMLSHRERCMEQGSRCPVYNPWKASACYEYDTLVQPWLSFCGPKPIAEQPALDIDVGEKQDISDWLGVRIPRAECDRHGPQNQAEMTRLLECSSKGQEAGLVIGEDYFESLTLLRGILAARKRLVVLDLGSAWGYWAVKAAVAWRRLRFRGGPCRLVLVETDSEMLGKSAEHVQRNGVSDYCNVTMINEPATPQLVTRLLRSYNGADLVHADIQGAEKAVFGNLQSIHKIGHLHISTHDREGHRFLKEFLVQEGFRITYDFMHRSFVETPIGPAPFDDGVLAGTFIRS
eukprot:TRINITY_DN21782_c0_g1_i1.p1 TRINITY_DN21782_c0_g1~~TRINITY_DN21782_c0_g1_i1.p1  ORF type:complete len:458 (-),score=58.01 TRINITY_DN21782_c0_g1_i1:3-1376(-)